MRAAEGHRVISALCAVPRVRARAVISALPVIIKRQMDEELYRAYSSDAMRITAENVSRVSGGYSMKERYADLIHPTKEETRTEEEIIAHVLNHGWGGEK